MPLRNQHFLLIILFIMRTIIVIILLCFFNLSLHPQNKSNQAYTLSVTLHNAPFTALALLDYRESHNVIIKGKHVGQFKWEFVIPEALVANSEFMELIIPEKDTIANAYRQVRFIRGLKNKKTTITNIGIQNETNSIEANYTGKTVFENENVASFLGKTDSVITGNLICDDFDLLIKNDGSDIEVRSIDPYYAWFDGGDTQSAYKEQLQSYISLAKKYPDSRYLMTYLSLNIVRFKTRMDLKKVYENFSAQQKSSKWAKRIERYLSNDFQNLQFINLNTNNIEPLVQDSLKYNLIIFTASWCGPCIKEIPLLKALHQDLKARMNFTYVSMDYESKVKAFQDILVKNEIPWRTLYAYKDQDRVTDLFSVKSIPLSILVYPDGRMERMDVREETNQKKLSLLR